MPDVPIGTIVRVYDRHLATVAGWVPQDDYQMAVNFLPVPLGDGSHRVVRKQDCDVLVRPDHPLL